MNLEEATLVLTSQVRRDRLPDSFVRWPGRRLTCPAARQLAMSTSRPGTATFSRRAGGCSAAYCQAWRDLHMYVHVVLPEASQVKVQRSHGEARLDRQMGLSCIWASVSGGSLECDDAHGLNCGVTR